MPEIPALLSIPEIESPEMPKEDRQRRSSFSPPPGDPRSPDIIERARSPRTSFTPSEASLLSAEILSPSSTPNTPSRQIPTLPSRTRTRNTMQRNVILAAIKTGSFRTVQVKSRRQPMGAFDPIVLEQATGEAVKSIISIKPNVANWRLPASNFRVYWETCNFLLYTSNAFLIPSRIIFVSRGTTENAVITVLAGIIQVTFFLDMVLRTFMFTYEDQGVLVTSPSAISSKYWATWGLYDFVGFFPFNFIAVYGLGWPPEQAVGLLVFQMSKLLRYMGYFRFIDVHFARIQVEASSAVREVGQVLVATVILLVMFGNVLIYVGCSTWDDEGYCTFDSDDCGGGGNGNGSEVANVTCGDPEVTWMENSILHEDTDHAFLHQINAAVYLVAQSLYTVGYGDVVVSNNNGERIFSIVMMFGGAFILATTIAVMSSVIANQDMLYMEFRQKMEELGNYMDHRAMGDATQQKLINHFEYLYMVQYGKEELSILEQLPTSLRKEVLFLNTPIILLNPFCKGVGNNFLVKQFSLHLKPWTYSPAETVIYANAPVFSIYMIRVGKVDILSPDQKSTITSLLENDHFGTFEFFFGTPSEYSHKTATFSEILVMERKDFETMMGNPRFDEECRAIDEGVDYVSSMLKKERIGAHMYGNHDEEEKEDGEDGGKSKDVDVVTENDLKEIETFVARVNKFHQMPDPSKPVAGTGRQYNHEDELEDEDLRRHLGIVNVFLEWRKHRISLQDKVAKLSKNLAKKNKFADMMNEGEEEKNASWVVLQSSRAREVYDCVSFLFTLWISIAVPYRLYLVGLNTDETWGYGIVVDYASDAFFFFNIILNARFFGTVEINEKGKLVDIVDKQRLFSDYYSSGRLLGDLITVIPCDVLGFLIGNWYMLRLPKLLMAARFPFLVTRLKNHLERHKIHVSLDAVMAGNLTIATIVVVVWIACWWGMLEENMVREDGAFVASIYWVLTTITTVGFGDIAPVSNNGRWFTVVVIIFGTSFTSMVIASITSMAHKVVISEDNSEHITTCVEKYMIEKELPLEIRDRCLRYFQMLQSHINNEKALENLVPPQFKGAVAAHNYLDQLTSTPTFALVSQCNGLLQRMAEMMVEQFVVEGDWVVRDNPSHDQWYYVKEGVCHLKGIKKGELLEVVKGQGSGAKSFGEHNLFFPNKKLYHVHASANCVLASLTPLNFNKLTQVYPDEFGIMKTFVSGLVEEWEKKKPLSEQSLRATRRNSLMQDMLIAGAASLNLQGRGGESSGSYFLSVLRGKQVVAPDGNMLLVWNLLVNAALLYNVLVIPFRMAFLEGDTLHYTLALDYIGDILFLLDVRLRMTAFAYMDGDKVEKDLKKIRLRYSEGGWLRGKSLHDAIAALPLEVLVLLVKIPALGRVQVFAVLRMNKMFRLSRLGEHIRCFDVMYAHLMSNGGKNELKVGKLFATILTFAHWLGCIFFFLAFVQYKMDMPSWADCSAGNPANRFFPCAGGGDVQVANATFTEVNEVSFSVVDRYIRSVYWASTALTTAGYGDVSATSTIERTFSIFTLIVGIMLFSTVIANLEEIVAQLDVTSTLFAQKMDEIKIMMEVRSIPDEVEDEIMQYYNTLWLKQKGVSEIAVLNYLPGRIRHEVLKFHCGKVFKTAPVFEEFESSFIDSILDQLGSDFFLTGDIVYEKGECGKELFILTRGAVDLVDGKNKLITVGMGSLLGEDEFFKHEPRICGAVAAEFCTTFFLLYDDLMTLMEYDRVHETIYQEQKIEAKDRIDTGSKIEKMKANLKGGGKMAMMLMLDDNVQEKKDLVYMPDSEFRRTWDLFLLVCCTGNFIAVPLRVAFYGKGTGSDVEEVIWAVVGLLLDVVFWVDIFFNTRFFAMVEEGLLITQREEFRRKYLKGRFKWDVLASLPADLVVWGIGAGSSRMVGLVRCLRFVHLGRLPGMLQSVVDYLEEKGVRLKAGVWHLAKMSYFIVVVTHIYACLLYYIAVLEGLDSEDAWTSGTDLENEELGLYTRYILCLYWSTYTITLVGFGDVMLKSNVEMIFCIIAMLTGSVLSDAGITAIMTSLVQATDESAGRAASWSKVISKFVKHRSIPASTQEQINGFFVHMHLTESDLNEEKVLNSQSRGVKTKLLRAICFEGMRKFPTLKHYADGFVKSICQGMYPYLALPTEILIAQGEVCDRVFLIVRGTVHVLEKSGGADGDTEEQAEEGELKSYKIVFTLEDGGIIGDFKPNEYTFRAVEYSECYVLDLEHYVDCFSYVHNNRKYSKMNIKDEIEKTVEETANAGNMEKTQRAQFIVNEKKERKETQFTKVRTRAASFMKPRGSTGSSGKELSGRSNARSIGRSRSKIEPVVEGAGGV